MAGQIEVVLLDVGGVLVPFAERAVVEQIERALALPPGGLAPLLYDCAPWHALSTGAMDEADYWQAIGAACGWEPEALRRLVRPAWEFAGVDAQVVALASAARRRVRVALFSNAPLALEEWLRALDVAHLFDPIINSSRIGLRKPDPRSFLRAVELLGVPPEAVLFVDDKTRNTQIAEELGIPSLHFTGAASLAAALEQYGILTPAAPLPGAGALEPGL